MNKNIHRDFPPTEAQMAEIKLFCISAMKVGKITKLNPLDMLPTNH